MKHTQEGYSSLCVCVCVYVSVTALVVSLLSYIAQIKCQWRIQDLRKGVSKFVEKAHVAAA